jgi:hypothetical protein
MQIRSSSTLNKTGETKIRNVKNYWRFRYLKVFGLSGLGQGLYGPKTVDDVPGLAEVDLVERAPDLVLHVLHQSACTKKTLKSRPEKTNAKQNIFHCSF